MGSFFAMINPKNNSENLKRNIHYKIITQPHPVVYIQCQQKSVKMSDKLHFLWQDKKANKVVKTHWTVFLFGVSNIWYQNNILKTFEKFMLHGSKNYCRKEDRASYGLSPSGKADILRPIREDGIRQSPTETMYEVSVQNWGSSNHKGTW